jgi:hypothetical protein
MSNMVEIDRTHLYNLVVSLDAFWGNHPLSQHRENYAWVDDKAAMDAGKSALGSWTPRARMTDPEALKAIATAITIAYDLHPVYGSTATWHGGIGGAAMTQGCSVIDTPPAHEKALEATELYWRQVLQTLDAADVQVVTDLRAALMRGEDIR